MNDFAMAVLDALYGQRQIAPITDDNPGFGLGEAYGVADAVMAARMARGETPVGWKIGFTNSTIWEQYGVHAPIWAPVYDRGLRACDPEQRPPELDADAFMEPQIEPEIVFRIVAPPRADMDDFELLGCIDAVAHGFEVVQSIFPGWRFRPADTIAAFGMHAALVVGPLVPVGRLEPGEWIARLSTFEITLLRNGVEFDSGVGTNVLGGPLSALRHFVASLAAQPMARGIETGDLVSTGTVTRAFRVSNEEIWSTRITGIPLPGLQLRFHQGFEGEIERLIERAAEARFRFENPAAASGADAYQDAMTAGVEAETALSRLLLHDRDKLNRARSELESRAQAKQESWKGLKHGRFDAT